MRNIDTNNQIFDTESTVTLTKLVFCFVITFAFFTIFSTNNFAQVVVTAPAPRPKATPHTPNPTAPPSPITNENIPSNPNVWQMKKKRAINESEFPAEKSIVADSKVNINIPCVSEGDVEINGWDRDEIRAFVKNGSEVGFKIFKKNLTNGKPYLVSIIGFDPQKNKQIGIDECLSGEKIELDVPRGASVSINSGQSSISIQSIYKATVKTDNGNIWLNDISQYVYARTFEGNVTVENSKGTLELNTTGGNILAFNVEPVEVSDKFVAKSSGGSITLQSIEHSIVESNSNSGIIKLISNISSGGQYKLITNGSIFLTIPIQSSCTINATSKNFQSDIPMKNLTEDKYPQVKRIVGQIGTGDANMTLQTIGSIIIKKSN